MRVEGHEVAKGLHIEDEGGLAVRVHGLEARFQQSGDQAAELPQIAATVAKEWPNQLRQGD